MDSTLPHGFVDRRILVKIPDAQREHVGKAIQCHVEACICIHQAWRCLEAAVVATSRWREMCCSFVLVVGHGFFDELNLFTHCRGNCSD